MIEINLVPDVKQELIQAQRVRATVISFSILISIGAGVIVTILAIYVFAVQTVRGVVVDGAIEEGGNKLASVQDLSKTLTIQNQLTKLSTLHEDKKINSRIFDVLVAIIPPAPDDIQISNLAIDSELQSISIEGQAARSYTAVDVFRKTIERATLKFTDETGTAQEVALASNVSTRETSYGEDASGAKVLRFTMSFNYAPELFSPLSKNFTIVIATQGNATDSYLGLPTSIFVDRARDLEEEQ